jgi:hypothetical protein
MCAWYDIDDYLTRDLPDFLEIRSFLDPSMLYPIRLGCFVSGSMIATFETWIDFSISTNRPGVAPCFFIAFLILLMPSTRTRSSLAKTEITFHSLFLSFPAMIRTRSQL